MFPLSHYNLSDSYADDNKVDDPVIITYIYVYSKEYKHSWVTRWGTHEFSLHFVCVMDGHLFRYSLKEMLNKVFVPKLDSTFVCVFNFG